MEAPLFDEDLAGESTLNYLEEIALSDFFEQLFIVALSSGFIITVRPHYRSKQKAIDLTYIKFPMSNYRILQKPISVFPKVNSFNSMNMVYGARVRARRWFGG